jgi:predicted nucleic acid-binding protein
VTLAEAVVDASAVVRGLTTEGEAAALLDRVAEGATVGHAPDLIVAEVSSALALAVRTERRSLGDAQSLFELLASSPIELHPTTPLAAAAIELAATREMSAYDAFYAVLAEALGVPLVTADRRLASAVAGSVLVE